MISKPAFPTKVSAAFPRLLLVCTLLMSSAAFFQVIQPAYERGTLFSSLRWKAVGGAGVLAILLQVAVLALSWTTWKKNLAGAWEGCLNRLAVLGGGNLVIGALGNVLVGLLVFGKYGHDLRDFYPRLFLFWLATLAGSVLLMAWSQQRASSMRLGLPACFGLALLVSSVAYKAFSFLPDISSYPFTLSWSEASRYYYASLYLSPWIYGFSVPPTVLHPSRYLMQAVPFLIPGSPIGLHRLWQVFLWLGTTALTAWALIHRLKVESRAWRWMAWGWIFLYILVGPIYYHLQVPALIMLLGFHTRNAAAKRGRFFHSLATVTLASIWAGISRINWFPVPGLLAAALILLEEPVEKAGAAESGAWLRPFSPAWRSTWAYLARLAGWVVFGTSIAFASQALYLLISGNTAEQFTSSFTSDLLWYRLLPNATYPTGILLGILILSLPLALFLYGRLTQSSAGIPGWRRYHPLRLLSLLAILLVLFGGGLVVSVKIGGGSNLHNMDAYCVLLLVVAAYFTFARAKPDFGSAIEEAPASYLASDAAFYPPFRKQSLFQAGLALALINCAFFTFISRDPPAPLPDAKSVSKALDLVTRYAQEASQSGGEVLFLSNRQLLTFHTIRGVALVPDYERVFLMEMAMANNSSYLKKFHQDLERHRFALIVSEPLFTQQKGGEEVFGEENDAWVRQVSRYVLCYYKPKAQEKSVKVQLLVPSSYTRNCP